MTALKRIGVGLLCFGVAPVWAASPIIEPQLPAVARVIAIQKVSVLTQVEYCMRNMPEIRLELALAHATFNQALDRAGDLLSQRFPSLATVRLGTDGRETALALKSAQAEGPDRLCVAMLYRMHNATGQSLAKDLEPSFQILLDKVSN